MRITTLELQQQIISRRRGVAAAEPSMTHRSDRDMALVIGGGNDPLTEYGCALELCRAAGRTVETIACNDAIVFFPDHLDNAVTLHPDKLPEWLQARYEAGRNAPDRVWAHRSFVGVTHWTRDLQGSSGLLCTKIARIMGLTHVILCGVPMSVEAEHVVRHQRWDAAHAFHRGWERYLTRLHPYVRSMSGWTRDRFGYPDDEWIAADIPDLHPMGPDQGGTTA